MGGKVPRLLVAVVLISLAVREGYPFSYFPMYSRFHPRTWYVYASDASGEALASVDSFRLSTPKLKKIYRTELAAQRDSIDAEQAAGRKMLEMLLARSRPVVSGLELWRVEIRRVGTRVVQERTRIAELDR